MNAYTKIVLICVIFACSVAPTFAVNGLYIGGSFGNTTVDDSIPTDQSVNDINFRSDDTAYKLFVGVNIAPFAIETSYVDFGKFSDSGVDVELTAMDAFGMINFAVGPVGLFGKFGFVRWDYDLDNFAANYSKKGTDAAYGLGARFDLGGLGFRVEYELFDVDEVDDLYMFSAGVTYTFL